MSNTVFFGNLPVWVSDDDIMSWLTAEGLVADSIKVIRNPQTQESKGYAFIDAPNEDEMNSIIRRFNRAPLEDRILRANPAQPPRTGGGGGGRRPPQQQQQFDRPPQQQQRTDAPQETAPRANGEDAAKRRKRKSGKGRDDGPRTVFGEQLAKVL